MHLAVTFWAAVMGNSTILAVGGFRFDLGWWFHLDREKKFGSLFNTLGILIAAGLMVYASKRALLSKAMALGWAMIACVLMYMACDEFFSINEYVGQLAGIDESLGQHVVPDWVKVMAMVVLVLIVPMGGKTIAVDAMLLHFSKLSPLRRKKLGAMYSEISLPRADK